jgi:ABC-type transport system involved in cytochrome c biogenesis permease subunit
MKRINLVVVFGCLAFASLARAESSGGLDWSAWQRMPVLQDGRIMPLDSFARTAVTKICGEPCPRLGKLGALTNAEMGALSQDELQRLARECQPRKFLAAELVYAWTVEPEKWDDVPFLLADDETLRGEVLDVPLRGEDGSRLRYVSPRQIRMSKKFSALITEMEKIQDEAQQKKEKPKFSALQEKVKAKVVKLSEAIGLFFQLSYDPGRPGKASPWLQSDFREANPWLMSDFAALENSWGRFAKDLAQHPALTVQANNLRQAADDEQARQKLQQDLFFQRAQDADEAMQSFVTQWRSVQSGDKAVRSVEPVAAEVRRLIAALDATMHELAKSELPDPSLLIEDENDTIRDNRQILLRWTKSLSLKAAQLPWGLYSAGGEAVSIVPSLEATALEADRYRSEIHPWISLQALLQASPDLLRGYPPADVQRIRAAWRDARAAYDLSRGDPERPRQFSQAMWQFTGEVRELAKTIEPDRQRLPIVEYDRGLLAKTAYPASFATYAEVLYNYVDPFVWSGRASLLAACILALSLLALRKPLFWTGVAVMIVAVALIAAGFLVRMYITHWAPVTSMFETVVWVTMCISLLTLWMTFLPLLGPTSKTAWSLTAIPGSWEVSTPPVGSPSADDPFAAESPGNSARGALARRGKNGREKTVAELSDNSRPGLRAVALTLRFVLFVAGVFGLLCYMGVLGSGYGGSGSGFRLQAMLPQTDLGASTPNLSASLVWAASMFVAVIFVWYLPRILPSVLLAIPMSLALAGREEAAERMEKIYRWRFVVLAGAVASFLAALAANYAPFPKDIEALMPVLRSNFWLGIHVLTIVTSYAGALAAWKIGNLALGFFVFGRYTTVEGKRRPPAFCGTLAWLNYRVMQVTVLLLAAGTILGGLWADVSWGRFWGWDPKEVGALIALLILLTALHGRRAGWHGDLSLAIGSVMGFGGVIWAWYVVNFILNAGLHSYGQGEGGQWMWLAGVGTVQLLFAAAAVARAMIETGQPATAPQSERTLASRPAIALGHPLAGGGSN